MANIGASAGLWKGLGSGGKEFGNWLWKGLVFIFSIRGLKWITFTLMILYLASVFIVAVPEAKATGDWSKPFLDVAQILINADQQVGNQLDILQRGEQTGFTTLELSKLIMNMIFSLGWIFAWWYLWYFLILRFTNTSQPFTAGVIATGTLLLVQIIIKSLLFWKFNPVPDKFTDLLVQLIPFRNTFRFFFTPSLWLVPVANWFHNLWIIQWWLRIR